MEQRAGVRPVLIRAVRYIMCALAGRGLGWLGFCCVVRPVCEFQILGLSANKKAIAPNRRPPPIDPLTDARSRLVNMDGASGRMESRSVEGTFAGVGS